MNSDALGKLPSWYMQMYHTQQMQHVEFEEGSGLTDLSGRKQNKTKKTKNENKCK